MSIFQKHLQDARRRLLFPTRASCDDIILSPYCIDTIDELVTRRQNTHEPGLIASGILALNPNQTTYNIDGIAPNYGKARYLYTRNDTNNPNFDRQVVELVSLEILNEEYRGGSTFGVLPSGPYLPSRFAAAVYYDVNQGNMIEVSGAVRQAVRLDLLYEPATLRPTSKSSPGFTLEQFDSLVAAKTALKALLHAQWKGLTRTEAREQRRDIKEQLIMEIGSPEARTGLDYLFWQFCNTSFQKTSDTTIGFLSGTLY